jgi:uncharacterized membrane-anchored protein
MRLIIDGFTVVIWLAVVVLAFRWPISTDPDVDFWIVMIGSGAVSGGCRFLLRESLLDREE